MKNLTSSLVLALTLSSLAFSQAAAKPAPKPAAETKVDPAFASSIRRLLTASGADKAGMQVVTQLSGSLRQAMPQVPDQFWTDFMKQVNANELTELVVPVYARHFTPDEVKKLTAFYESPIGKRYTELLPAVLEDSMQVGSAWGRKVAERAVAKLRASGYDPEHPQANPRPSPLAPNP